MVQILSTRRQVSARPESHPREWVDGSDPFYKEDKFLPESHPREWVDGSNPFYKGDKFLAESHPREWVDGSDPFYKETASKTSMALKR